VNAQGQRNPLEYERHPGAADFDAGPQVQDHLGRIAVLQIEPVPLGKGGETLPARFARDVVHRLAVFVDDQVCRQRLVLRRVDGVADGQVSSVSPVRRGKGGMGSRAISTPYMVTVRELLWEWRAFCSLLQVEGQVMVVFPIPMLPVPMSGTLLMPGLRV